MNEASDIDYTHRLRSLMQSVGVSSFKALSQAAGLSEWQIRQLRQGKAAHMRVEAIAQLSRVLQVSLSELIDLFSELTFPAAQPEGNVDVGSDTGSDPGSDTESDPGSDADQVNLLRQEYQRLQDQLDQQHQLLQQEFQRNTLHRLETLLTFWPTVAYKVREEPDLVQKNPQAIITTLLRLLLAVEQLLKDWGIEAIAVVGEEVLFDPQQHQMTQGQANPGDLVRVVNLGYRQGDKLLYRAKVSLV